MTGEDGFFIFQEDQVNGSFVNPYNDNPYIISSLQRLKQRLTCKRKQSVVDRCLDDYKDQSVDNPQLNHIFETGDMQPQKSSLADYAKSSYQKVLKDLDNIQMLIDQLGINEVRL